MRYQTLAAATAALVALSLAGPALSDSPLRSPEHWIAEPTLALDTARGPSCNVRPIEPWSTFTVPPEPHNPHTLLSIRRQSGERPHPRCP